MIIRHKTEKGATGPAVTMTVGLLLVTAVALAAPDPVTVDDAFEMVLAVDSNCTGFSWELKYGQARQKALEYLKVGQKEKALAAAKMQFLLCPLEPVATDAAIAGVKQMLFAFDGNDVRAKLFEEYARNGPAGADGKVGTADDLADPIRNVSLSDFARSKEFYAEFDKTLDGRAAIVPDWQKEWYETEKAFARLDGAGFSNAATILAEALSDTVQFPFARDEENWELRRMQNIVDRIQAGLSVVYRARTGTIAGANEFIQACMDYAKCGPAGSDGKIGSTDDLKPPM